MEDNGKELARYEGSMYGLTLRYIPRCGVIERPAKYIVWGFNTSAAREHGFPGGFYREDGSDHCFETLAEASKVFCDRVAHLVRGARGESCWIEDKRAAATAKLESSGVSARYDTSDPYQ